MLSFSFANKSLLVQVLNNRMFESNDAKAKRLDEEIVDGEVADKTYGFQLPEDEPGQVRRVVAGFDDGGDNDYVKDEVEDDVEDSVEDDVEDEVGGQEHQVQLLEAMGSQVVGSATSQP